MNMLVYALNEIKNLCDTNDPSHKKFWDVAFQAVKKYEEKKEIVSEPVQNALYSTGNFTTDQCTQLAEGILLFLDDAGYELSKKWI